MASRSGTSASQMLVASASGVSAQRLESGRVNEVHPGRPLVESGNVEEEHLTHADAHRPAVVRVNARRVEEQGIDAEGTCRTGDQPEVLGVVEAFQYGDAAGPGEDLGDARQGESLGRGDDAAVEVESDGGGDDVLVGDDDDRAGDAGQRLDTPPVFGRDEDCADPVWRLDQSLDGDQTLGDEDLVAFAPTPRRRIGEVDEVGEALVVGAADRHVASGRA